MLKTANAHQNIVHIIGENCRLTTEILKDCPVLWLLFLGIGFLDLVALGVLFLAPSEPFSVLLAPIIRTFWGERFLHYPENFLLLPKLLNHAHVLILTFFGIFVTGMIIKKTEAYFSGSEISFVDAGVMIFRKYFVLMAAWVICYGLFMLIIKKTLPLLPPQIVLRFGGSFVLGIFFQVLSAFFLPMILLSGKGLFPSLWDGLKLSLAHSPLILILASLPLLVLLLSSFFKAMTPVYIQFNPELTLGVLVLGIAVSLAVDFVLTSSLTVLFLQLRRNQTHP